MQNMKEETTSVEKLKKLAERFLFKADPDLIHCVDERQGDGQTFDLKNAVELPGSTGVFIDYIKNQYKDISEEQAWDMARSAGIPIGAHQGPDHSHHVHSSEEKISPKGCGYNLLVETNPSSVLAPESVSASHRYHLAAKYEKAQLYDVHGPHIINVGVIVRKHGFSIDSDRALAAEHIGILGCDVWAAELYAQRWNRTFLTYQINTRNIVIHTEKVFRKVKDALAPDAHLLIIE